MPGADEGVGGIAYGPAGLLVRALSQAETAVEVAQVIAEEGAVAAGAEFANIAVLDVGATRAHLYNASSPSADVAERHPAVPADDSTPLGAVLSSGREIWLPSLADAGARYPLLPGDTVEAGLASAAALALRDRYQSLARAHPLDDGPDQIALTALGSTIADALSRAARHDSDRELVISVQRSLLAGTLPDSPGVRLGTYYRPAETRYGIGGDWYDAVLLPDGQMALIVGRCRRPWAGGCDHDGADAKRRPRPGPGLRARSPAGGPGPVPMRHGGRTVWPPPQSSSSTPPKAHSAIASPDIRPPAARTRRLCEPARGGTGRATWAGNTRPS